MREKSQNHLWSVSSVTSRFMADRLQASKFSWICLVVGMTPLSRTDLKSLHQGVCASNHTHTRHDSANVTPRRQTPGALHEAHARHATHALTAYASSQLVVMTAAGCCCGPPHATATSAQLSEWPIDHHQGYIAHDNCHVAAAAAGKSTAAGTCHFRATCAVNYNAIIARVACTEWDLNMQWL